MRKRLRKSLFVTVTIILLCLGVFVGYLKYQERSSYKTLIPQNTTALIRIDVYAIFRSMIGEAFSSRKSRKEQPFRGIEIPANIFCYTVSDKQSNTWFTSLPISNVEQWEQSVKRMPTFAARTDMSDIILINGKDARWTFAYNKQRVVIAFSASKEDVTDVMKAILTQQNMMAVFESKYQSIKALHGHITFLQGKNEGSLSFETGLIQANLNLQTVGVNVPGPVQHYQAQGAPAIHMWLFADFSALLKGKTFHIDTFQISGDSILQAHPKGVQLFVGDPESQNDSIVTYEYNDDFEKVATVTRKQVMVPGAFLCLQSDAGVLQGYMQRHKLINGDYGQVNKAVFPLYKLYTFADDGQLLFTTASEKIATPTLTGSNNFFGLEIDFIKITHQDPFSIFHPYIKQLKRLEASGTKTGPDRVSIEAKLYLKDEQRQALATLLDNL